MKSAPVIGPVKLSRAETRILEALAKANRPANRRRGDVVFGGGMSLGDLELATGYEGEQLTRTLAIMEQKGLLHAAQLRTPSHYTLPTFTKYFSGPAPAKERAA